MYNFHKNIKVVVFFKILATPEWLFYHKPSIVEVSIMKPTHSRHEPSLLEIELITKQVVLTYLTIWVQLTNPLLRWTSQQKRTNQFLTS